ncbi:ParA family protein [Pseudoalteromonas sp. SK20]|uniref:ParA family protein n=1 Tax=Pseudoalteromonas sp. SK20 TaxID=1938367 RepID=UPI000977B3C6|nr:AAA family ATPase [Pseudoalteromonas sp. SK20]
MSIEETSQAFEELGVGADNYISRRNQRLLSNHKKELRTFTRSEAIAYLDLDGRTLDKYALSAGIDPRRHEDAKWLIDIEEMYIIRSLLPSETRKEAPFQRSKDQKLQVITVQNQKGGVGKTVSVATIGSCLATEFHQEYRVGIIDMDGQATLSMYYAPESDSLEHLSAGDLITKEFDLDEGETFKDAVSKSFLQTTIPNLRILPASQSDRALEGWFHKKTFNGDLSSPYSLLNDVIKEVEDEFDIILIDTPPSLGYATFNSYFAATSIVFPLTTTENDVDATCSYFSYIREVWQLLLDAEHDGYDFMKIMLTNHKDSATATELMSRLSTNFSQFLYSKEFKHSEAVRQSSALMSTVFDMSKSEYPKTKSTFAAAQTNAYEVTSQLLRDIQKVWRNPSKEY